MPPERTIDVLGQNGYALDPAHRRGLVHRDVKQANVLLDEDGHAYLTDFGLTLAAGAGDAAAGGRVPGTLDYLAPEQIRGEEIDARTDQYALACVLYECLAGVPPFRRATVAETLWAHLHEAPPPLSAQGALEPVLERGLAKGMEERYSTCGELAVARVDVCVTHGDDLPLAALPYSPSARRWAASARWTPCGSRADQRAHAIRRYAKMFAGWGLVRPRRDRLVPPAPPHDRRRRRGRGQREPGAGRARRARDARRRLRSGLCVSPAGVQGAARRPRWKSLDRRCSRRAVLRAGRVRGAR